MQFNLHTEPDCFGGFCLACRGAGSVRDLGSIFHKAGEFYGRCGFAPLRLDAPADLVSWPVPPLKTKTTAAALVQ